MQLRNKHMEYVYVQVLSYITHHYSIVILQQYVIIEIVKSTCNKFSMVPYSTFIPSPIFLLKRRLQNKKCYVKNSIFQNLDMLYSFL